MTEPVPPTPTDPAALLRSRSAPIIERAPLPIVEVQGNTHRVSYVNAAFCTLLGKNRGELIGKTFAEIVPGGGECVPILDRVYQTGEGITHAQLDDSEPAHWLYAMWPALDLNERPEGVIIQLTKSADFRQNATAVNEALLIAGLRQHELKDAAETLNLQLQAEATERAKVETELRQAKDWLSDQAAKLERSVADRTEKLRETVQELQAFSYSVAHDMRAPLRGMQGFARILLEEHAGQFDPVAHTYLERIVRAACRMDMLIQDVLNYTRVLQADMILQPVELDQLVPDLVATYENWRAPKAEILIEGTLPTVLGHEAFVTQCVSNVISNAVKFVRPDVTPRVRIWAELRNDRVRLWFEDNGIGIARKDHARVFRMFERINPTDDLAGTGIGLTIVRKAAERMNGQIGFESELGKGSRFWIELKKAPEPEST